MNRSMLYILPTSNNTSILKKAIPKTRSLSDLEMIIKMPLEGCRRNSVSGPVTINTSLSSEASTVEDHAVPFKTLPEAQIVANLLKQKDAQSSIPDCLNLHNNLNGKPDSAMSTKSQENCLGNLTLYMSSKPQMVFSNKSKELMSMKPLSAIGVENQEICSLNPNVGKIEDTFYTSTTIAGSSLSSDKNSETWAKLQSGRPTSPQASAVGRTCQQDSIESSKECEAEAESPNQKKIPVRKKNRIPSIIKVNSLVFFDLETTGLACQIGKSNVQITEVSMIAINRKEFEQSTFEDLSDIRIIQKLCLCTRPRSNVSSGAAAITGLNNENLMDQNHFERNAAEAINLFLSHLPKPVCLLAHNGNSYDFPLLKAEFSRLNMSLPPDILIADTLKAFKVLGVPVFPPEKKICKSVKFNKNGQVSYSLPNLHLYFFNKNPTGSHSSEGDCIALARICHRMKDLILLWIDENCGTFDSVSSMW